jgi:YebC/PmpR family DNA-binding regulatory protein
MSGHSKWATIKRKKGTTDARRSNMYAKLLRAIEVAAREGGGNVEGNMTLASAVDKAKSFSVPAENIDRAIKRGTGDDASAARYEELMYEGYAPGGVALLIQVLTDNRNRTGQEIRHAFTRCGGNLGDQGSTAWMFTRKGLIVVDKATAPVEDKLLELALEAGAEDVRDAESSWEIVTQPSGLRPVVQVLTTEGVQIESSELTMLTQTSVPVAGGEAKAVLTLIEALEELDDVQSVFANFDIPEEMMASLGG